MAKAVEADMESLHGALCSYFLRLIRGEIDEMVERKLSTIDPDNGDMTSTTEWVKTGLKVRPGAGDLAVMAKFLKDNAITGVAVQGSELSELEDRLASRHARRGKLPTAADAAEAMREIGHNLVQ